MSERGARHEGGFRGRGRTDRVSSGVSRLTSFAFIRMGSPEKVTRFATESFCGGCDNLSGGTCQVVNSSDQARYVSREWCGWAKEREKRGEMTFRGFQSGSTQLKPQ